MTSYVTKVTKNIIKHSYGCVDQAMSQDSKLSFNNITNSTSLVYQIKVYTVQTPLRAPAFCGKWAG